MNNQFIQQLARPMNEQLALDIIQKAEEAGVKEFCLCPGSRNSPLCLLLGQRTDLQIYYWFEERSAAFFALGRSRATKLPVAVVTTSGTACGELLAASMEGYYTGVPILLLTADRPRRFRGTGAPQSAEQVDLFGIYTPFAQDIEEGEECLLGRWDRKAPAHVNIRFEDPKGQPRFRSETKQIETAVKLPRSRETSLEHATKELDRFLKQVTHPLVVVGSLPQEAREPIAQFLLKLNAPVFLEGISGLREDVRLAHLRISRTEGLWESMSKAGYTLNGILRLGGVPTVRLWRDLEDKENQFPVCSISDQPFSGLSWAGILCVSLPDFFYHYQLDSYFETSIAHHWLDTERMYRLKLQQLFSEELGAESSLVHSLSCLITKKSNVYLGNSLPIREWDLAATLEDRHFSMTASRGLSGIDGQISTFLGLSDPIADNWALLGDLTTLYDLAAPWIIPQLDSRSLNIVVINNGGGKLFARLYPNNKEFIHPHQLSFESFANMWGLEYERWTSVPQCLPRSKPRLIELIPDDDASTRFWSKLAKL